MSRLGREVFCKRMNNLRNKMQEKDIDSLFVYSDIWRCNNVAYLSDYRQGGGGIGQSWTALLISQTCNPTLFVGFEEIGCAEIQLKIDADIRPSTEFEDFLKNYKKTKAPKRVGIVGNQIILNSVYKAVERTFDEVKILDCDLMLAQDRWVKSTDEIELIKSAFAISDKAIEKVISAVHEGVSEKELYSIGTAFLAENNCDLAFIPTVNIGINSGIAMKRTADKRLNKDELIMLDFGASYEGYTSDTTRTVGFYLSDPFKRGILTAALYACETGIASIAPGKRFCELEVAVRNAISEKGYGEHILHNVGHGLGIDSSEEDLPIGMSSDIIMEPGMVFTVEPGIYVKGVGGCRLEECVYVTETGCEVFSSLKRDWFIE